jgi:hypothetical protein
MQHEYYSFCKQLGQCPSTNYAMSKNDRGFEMGIGKAGRILAPAALFVCNLPVALDRSLRKIIFGSGGRVDNFACMDFGQ